jgi:hypothetical protein
VLEAFTVVHRAFPRWVSSRAALREVQLLVELLADRAAVRRVGARPLARALVSMADSPAPESALAASGSGPAASGSGLTSSGSDLTSSRSDLTSSGSDLTASGSDLTSSRSDLTSSGADLTASGSDLTARVELLTDAGRHLLLALATYAAATLVLVLPTVLVALPWLADLWSRY